MLQDQPVAELAQHAERIRRSLRSPIKIAGQEIVLTGSIGIAVSDGEETSHADLLKKAEIAMFRAKRAGADRIEVFSPDMRGDQDDRRALETELRHALEKNQIRVVFLPVIYLPTEELAGFEAVAQWDHPKLGAVDPSALMPFADDSDLAVKLGLYLLQHTSRNIIGWQKEFPRSDAPLFVSINIASRHLFRQDVVQEVRHILGRTVVPKGSIRIGVTEQVALENPEQSTEILAWLRGAGAEIVLDEFGIGYSSLSYLERLPFDTLKIDQAFMQAGAVKGGSDSVLVRAMVTLAHELGKKIVAKGVETVSEVSFLRSIDCEYAQGPYCGNAIAEADVAQVLAAVRASESKHKPVGVFRPKSKKKPLRMKGSEDKPADRAATAPPAAVNGAAAPRANGADTAPRPSAPVETGAQPPQHRRMRLGRLRPEAGASGPPSLPKAAAMPPPPQAPPAHQPPPGTAPPAAHAPPPPPPPLVTRLADVLPDATAGRPVTSIKARAQQAGAASGTPSMRPGDVPPPPPPQQSAPGRRAPPPPSAVGAPAAPAGVPPLPPQLADAPPARPLPGQPAAAPPPIPLPRPQMAASGPPTPFPPPLGSGAASVKPERPAAPVAPASAMPPAARTPAPARPGEPDFSNLPPAIAESLARLAGVSRKSN
jgi:EAL domain-containing protein (putative c-di-GMP-specific phosphodiesterase class I)